MCDVCNSLNVDQVTIRVAQCLKEYCLGVLINGILEVLNVIRIYKLGGHAVLRQGVLQIVVGAAVNGLGCYNVVALMCQRLKRVGQSRCAGSNCQCGRTALQCCDTLFKDVLRRVGQTAVNVAGISQTEAGSCVVAVVEHIRSGLINRHGTCIGCRVSLFLANVQL